MLLYVRAILETVSAFAWVFVGICFLTMVASLSDCRHIRDMETAVIYE
jgi:hypothetical protein